MVPYARREHAKRRRDDAGASGSIVRDEWERDDNSPAPHEVVEEEVFDETHVQVKIHSRAHVMAFLTSIG